MGGVHVSVDVYLRLALTTYQRPDIPGQTNG
jgi:hypothetical protein